MFAARNLPLYKQFHLFMLSIPSVITDIHSQPLSKLYQTNGTTQYATMHLRTRLPQENLIIRYISNCGYRLCQGNVFLDLILQRPAKLAMRPKPRTSIHTQQKHVNNPNAMVGTTGYPSKGHLHSNTSGWIHKAIQTRNSQTGQRWCIKGKMAWDIRKSTRVRATRIHENRGHK